MLLLESLDKVILYQLGHYICAKDFGYESLIHIDYNNYLKQKENSVFTCFKRKKENIVKIMENEIIIALGGPSTSRFNDQSIYKNEDGWKDILSAVSRIIFLNQLCRGPLKLSNSVETSLEKYPFEYGEIINYYADKCTDIFNKWGGKKFFDGETLQMKAEISKDKKSPHIFIHEKDMSYLGEINFSVDLNKTKIHFFETCI